MKSLEIFKKANGLVRSYNTRDPFVIAEGLKILTIFEPDYRDLLGMYYVDGNNRFMFLNDHLEEEWYPLVVAHEIGHDRLHRQFAKKNGLREFVLFNLKNNLEYEANVFAAHLLLDNDEVFDLAVQGYDLAEMAGLLHTHINLLIIKLAEMARLGYNLRVPCEPDGRFLRKCKGRDVTRCE